jgi:hypothetical protein
MVDECALGSHQRARKLVVEKRRSANKEVGMDRKCN